MEREVGFVSHAAHPVLIRAGITFLVQPHSDSTHDSRFLTIGNKRGQKVSKRASRAKVRVHTRERQLDPPRLSAETAAERWP